MSYIEHIPTVKNGIRGAILRNITTCGGIAKHIDQSMETTFNVLRVMITEGEVQKTRCDSIDHFSLIAQENGLSGGDEVKKQVLDALALGYRTYPQIQKFLKVERSVPIGELLEKLEFDRAIRKHVNADCAAFFRWNERPKDFWLEGGQVKAIFEEAAADDADEFEDEPEEEILVKLKDAAAAETAKEEPVIETAPEPAKRGYSTKKIDIDKTAFRLCAEAGMSMNKTAEKLGVSFTTISRRIEKDKEFARIWQDGQKRWTLSGGAGGTSAKAPKGIVWSPAYLENLGTEYYSNTAAAKSLGISPYTITFQAKKNQENADAWARGRAKYLETNPKPVFGRPSKTAQPNTENNMKAIQTKEVEQTEVTKPALKCASCGEQYTLENPVPENEMEYCSPDCAAAEKWKNSRRESAEAPSAPPLRCANCDTEFTIESFQETEVGNFCNEKCLLEFATTKINAFSEPEELLEIPEVKTDERFARTIEHISENGRSLDSIEQVKQSVAAVAQVLPPPNRDRFNHFTGVAEKSEKLPVLQNIGSIPLSGGAKIVVGFDGNFFEMNGREREILNKFANLMDEYKAGN